ncbi:DUF2637 domain-containing protein [Kitasatospora griseola]|uniref:DUF2637 domain-containing protein n=1 Tax=Kitasatospora griseola TaxID=2064 RepID=UPI003424C37A
MSDTTAPRTAHVTGWDRTVVVTLGLAASALSYDALQQMAVAIHIRGFLTYLMPLVIDGFISYGVRGLLVLRDAPLQARAYVWILFGTATAASLWANALHAVRLNQLHAADGGLRLGDSVVAVLSTIAPLALAGAVHLYILIARRPSGPTDRAADAERTQNADWTTRTVGQGSQGDHPPVTAAGQVTALTGSVSSAKAGRPAGQPAGARPVNGEPVTPGPVNLAKPGQLVGRPDSTRQVGGRPATVTPVAAGAVSLTKAGHPVGRPADTLPVSARTTGERRSDPDTEGLLAIAREAVASENRLTRKVVAEAIRGQQIPLSSDTLTQLMAKLREQHRQPVAANRN